LARSGSTEKKASTPVMIASSWSCQASRPSESVPLATERIAVRVRRSIIRS
jgi:hypothetical protein